MNEKLQEALKPGETLLWSGRAGEFKAMDGKRKPQLLRKLIITLVITVAVLAAYVIYTASIGGRIIPAIFAFILIVGGYSSVFALTESAKIRSLIYAVTDKRVIVADNNYLNSVEYDKLGGYRIVKDTDGTFSFVAGRESGKLKESQLLTYAPLGVRLDEKKECRTLVMFAVNEPELFMEAITPYLK